jgi:hypothetical protein
MSKKPQAGTDSVPLVPARPKGLGQALEVVPGHQKCLGQKSSIETMHLALCPTVPRLGTGTVARRRNS